MKFLKSLINTPNSYSQAEIAARSQHLGLIPQRMPGLNIRAAEFSDAGYSVMDVDPPTGAQRAPFLRFDEQGRLFGATPDQLTAEERAMLSLNGAPDYPQLNAYMLNSALKRSAIAPMWEVKTARMQQEIGDPNAGVTEEECTACYELNSCFQPPHRGWRHISLITSPETAVNEAYWRDVA